MLIAASEFNNSEVMTSSQRITATDFEPVEHIMYSELSTKIPNHWGWSDDPYNKIHQRWLSYRLKLTKRMLLSSLRAQHFNINWHPIIAPYPEAVKEDIARRLGIDKSDFLECDRSSSDDPAISKIKDVASSVTRHIKERYAYKRKSDARLIISKVDSDDGLSAGYSLIVQLTVECLKKSTKVGPLMLDFPYGVQYMLSEGSQYATLWPESGFINLTGTTETHL